jgi:hypothetical protein
MDQMDVDQTSSTSKRSADFPLAKPPFEKRPWILLSDVELANLNQGMRDESEYLNMLWKELTANDSDLTSLACAIVLRKLHAKLKSTSMKDIVVPHDSISDLVESLNLEELNIDVTQRALKTAIGPVRSVRSFWTTRLFDRF